MTQVWLRPWPPAAGSTTATLPYKIPRPAQKSIFFSTSPQALATQTLLTTLPRLLPDARYHFILAYLFFIAVMAVRASFENSNESVLPLPRYGVPRQSFLLTDDGTELEFFPPSQMPMPSWPLAPRRTSTGTDLCSSTLKSRPKCL
jgi:hypothetical protein